MYTDFIINRSGNLELHGEVAQALQGLGPVRFDPGLMRPYRRKDGQICVNVDTGRRKDTIVTNMFGDKEVRRVPVREEYTVNSLRQQGVDITTNATTLRKEEWIMLDRTVLTVARKELRAWGDLEAASPYGGFDGMSKTILEHETMSDPGQAVVDMDGLTDATTDRPKWQLEGLPLPITHSDFNYGSRELAVSRNSGTPLSDHSAEAASRRVAESVEKTTIGVTTGITYGGGSSTPTYGRASTVFGYTNFTNRVTRTTNTVPTGNNPEVTVADVLAMRQSLYNVNHKGPYMLYHSTDWDLYLDNDYARLGGNNASMTLRNRLRSIEGIQDVRRLDYLTNTFTLLLVEMDKRTAQAVNGLPITTIQWPSKGGFQQNFKVLCIQVPRLRADFLGQCGICHGTTA